MGKINRCTYSLSIVGKTVEPKLSPEPTSFQHDLSIMPKWEQDIIGNSS